MADAFIGIDPDDTVEVEYHGVTVTVGVIPSGVWTRLSGELAVSHRDAKRHAIKLLREQGIDPEDTKDLFGQKVTVADLAAMNDPTHRENVLRVCLHAVGWAVRGHKNWNTRKNEPVPCTLVTKNYEGIEVQVLDKSTLRYYAANKGLMDAVYGAIKNLQELGPEAKKVSPPQP